MSNPPTSGLALALDIADKAIKLAAVCLGGLWTFWSFRKSRTYAQRVELELAGLVSQHGATYLEISAGLRNLGASKHPVEPSGSYCEIFAVSVDLIETSLRIIQVFQDEDFVEPGESISSQMIYKLPDGGPQLLWLRIILTV